MTHYKMLEIDENATIKEIKKAYKSLAIKLHPDRTQGNEVLAEKFKSVKFAYEILSNESEKQKYDRSLKKTSSKKTNHPFGKSNGFDPFNSSSGKTNKHTHVKKNQFAEDWMKQYESSKKTDLHVDLNIAINGGFCDLEEVNGRTHSIHVPANTLHGTSIIHKVNDHETIIVNANLKLKDNERIDGNNVIIKHNVDIFTMIGGGLSQVDLFGKHIKIKIKECTQLGTKLKLPKRGFNNGDVIIEIQANMPTNIPNETKELLKTLKANYK